MECYKNSSDFREMLQDNYSCKREILSEFDIFMLEEIIGYGIKLDMIISPTYYEPSYKDNDEILKAAAMLCVSDIIKQNLGYKDGIVPYSDHDKIYSQLQSELSSIDIDHFKKVYMVIKKFVNVGYKLPKVWYTNIAISNILDIIGINIDSLDESTLLGKTMRRKKLSEFSRDILDTVGFKPLDEQDLKKK